MSGSPGTKPLDIVAGEIVRVRQTYGPGAVFNSMGSHHTWGNVGYYISAAKRFFNCIGATETLPNPDSWEGFAWGAMHHYGGSARRGATEPFSTVEDCMKNAEMIVFWSSDPESTSGVYGAQEGTVRRDWVKELGIPVVHIDPYLNSTAAFMGGRWICPRPATDTALALAIAYVWLKNGTYDKDYVAKRTFGLDKWQEYIFGETDGVPKTPEWQAPITGVEARVVRALAEAWGARKNVPCQRRHSLLRQRLPDGLRDGMGARHGLPGRAAGGSGRKASISAASRWGRRWTRISGFPATPTAASPAITSPPERACSSTTACLSPRPSIPNTRRSPGSASPRPSWKGTRKPTT